VLMKVFAAAAVVTADTKLLMAQPVNTILY
jgi:hypothetical protein